MSGERFERIEGMLSQLIGMVGGMQKDRNEMKKDMAGMQKSIHSMQKDMTGMQKSIHLMREDMTGMQKSIHLMLEDMAGMQKSIHSMQEDMKGMQKSINSMQEDMKEMKAVQIEHGKKFEAIEARFDKMESKNEARHKELVKQVKRLEKDQDFIWEKAARNERELEIMKRSSGS